MLGAAATHSKARVPPSLRHFVKQELLAALCGGAGMWLILARV